MQSDQEALIRQHMRHCGQLAAKLAQQEFQVSQKGPEDYVTTVDTTLDQYLTLAFRALMPADGLITEENPGAPTVFAQPHTRLWCIDPLDGTEEFIQGGGSYAVMVGLLDGGHPQAGWIYHPASDQTYCGGPGWGVFRAIADAPLQPLAFTPPPPLSASACRVMIGVRDRAHFGAALERHIADIQFASLGSFGLKVMEVVQGRAGLYLYLNGRVKVWDTAGPLAIAQAAGLVCCDLTAQPIRFDATAVDAETLAHHQAIIVGWPQHLEALLPRIQQAVQTVTASPDR